MNSLKRIAAAVIAAAVSAAMLTGCSKGSEEVMPEESKGFIHVENGKVVDGSGEATWLKGIAFGNDVWTTHQTPITTDHDESSYKDLSEMGFKATPHEDCCADAQSDFSSDCTNSTQEG